MVRNIDILETQVNDLETILAAQVQDLASEGERVRFAGFSEAAFEPQVVGDNGRRLRVLTLISTPSTNEITDFGVSVITPTDLVDGEKTIEQAINVVLNGWRLDGIVFAEADYSDSSFDFEGAAVRAKKVLIMIGYNAETVDVGDFYPQCQVITIAEPGGIGEINLAWELDAGDIRTNIVIPTKTIIHISQISNEIMECACETMHIYSIEPCNPAGAGNAVITGLNPDCAYRIAITPLYDDGGDTGPYFGPRQDYNCLSVGGIQPGQPI